MHVYVRRHEAACDSCGVELHSLLPLRIHGNKQLTGNTGWVNNTHTVCANRQTTTTHTHIKNPRKNTQLICGERHMLMVSPHCHYANESCRRPLPRSKHWAATTANNVTVLWGLVHFGNFGPIPFVSLSSSAEHLLLIAAFTHLMNHQPSRFFWMTSTVTPFSKLTSSFPWLVYGCIVTYFSSGRSEG